MIREGSVVPIKDRIRKSSRFMHYDPFTLIIATDNNGFASGRLYADDGLSEDFAKGSFVDREFTLQNGKLSNKAVTNGFDRKFLDDYDVKVERIKITGYPSKPSSVKGPNGELEFEYEDGVIDISKANLLVRDDWTLTIQ